MVFVNEAYKVDALPLDYIEGLVKMLSPIIPHISEELWTKLGHVGSITYEKWPVFDTTKLVEDTVEVVLQVNGKVRQRLAVSKQISKDVLEKMALSDEKIKKEITGKDVIRVIVVPGKLVNIVVK